MSKQEGSKTRYFVQWDTHARHMCTVLCSLMEHQSLVDLAICCGTNTIHAHKCVLAANSPYFREQLEKNAGTEQVVITGLDFAIVKSLIEFMYCGETNILDENLKYMIAAAKFFQIRGLQTLVSNHQELRYEAETISIPPPMFLPKKPKYPNAYRQLNNAPVSPAFGPYKAPLQNDPYLHRKMKRKVVRTEAEKACAKEAAASRLALEALQKELANTTQMSSFVIEESCTETTVENFIPHSDDMLIENVNNLEGVPLQIVNYEDLNGSILTANQMLNISKPECSNSTLQFEVRGNASKDKLNRLLGTDSNIEIMYRTNEGEIVNVTADVLQNLSGDGLQYQIVDENGQIREIREFQADEQNCSSAGYETTQCVTSLDNPLTEPCTSDSKHCAIVENEDYMSCSNFEMLNSNEVTESSQNFESVDKCTDADEPVSQTVEPYNHDTDEHHNHDAANGDISNSGNELINISSSSSGCSTENLSNDTTSTMTINNTFEIDFPENLNSPEEMSASKEQSSGNEEDQPIILEGLGTEENKENSCPENEKGCEPLSKERKKRSSVKKPDLLGVRILRTMTTEKNRITGDLNPEVPKWSKSKNSRLSKNTKIENASVLANIDLTGESTSNVENLETEDSEDGGGDCKPKKIKLNQASQPVESNLITNTEGVQILNDVAILETLSPRKTRSSLKTSEDQSNECKDGDDYLSHVKYDKPRRIMPNRKKK